jgi:multicomponent Na+:H+ antiporter subunit C
VITSGLRRGQAPIYPLDQGQPVSDPLAQAMTLTALVIGFATTALLLVMAYRVYTTHRSVDLDDLARSERRAEEELEGSPEVEREQAPASAADAQGAAVDTEVRR